MMGCRPRRNDRAGGKNDCRDRPCRQIWDRHVIADWATAYAPCTSAPPHAYGGGAGFSDQGRGLPRAQSDLTFATFDHVISTEPAARTTR